MSILLSLSHRRGRGPLRACVMWIVRAQTQLPLPEWPSVQGRSQVSACPGSECKYGLCRPAPSLLLGWAVTACSLYPHISCSYLAALPIEDTHSSRHSSPPCHMPLLPSPRLPRASLSVLWVLGWPWCTCGLLSGLHAGQTQMDSSGVTPSWGHLGYNVSCPRPRV